MPGRDKPLIIKNGMPIPQSYNPQSGNWESYIGVSWGKTSGGLYVPVAVTDEGHVKVQQAGTMDTREVIRPRALLTEGEKGVTVKNVPTGAKGLVAQLIVHGISGTWDANGGVSFRMAHYSQSRSAYHFIYDSMNSSSPGDIVVKMYPGLGTAVPTGGSVNLTGRWSNVNDILEERIGFRIDITGGTFSAEQGVDCELRVRWFFG